MIAEDNVWVWSYNKENEFQDKDSCGKWTLTGTVDYFLSVFGSIDELVNKGDIHMAKFSHRKHLFYDSLPYNDPVLCIYADDLTKDRTYDLLQELGIEPEEWKYDSDTKKDWEKGGKLWKESYRQRTLFLLELSEKF